MRLLELHLLRFGIFEDARLCLDPGAGLQLIYGDNEAGKSTSLRALLGFLFGIPGNTADAHRFRMPELRVGATVTGSDGRALRLVRRKGNRDTLLGEDGSPVDEAVLARLLGGISASVFGQLYGLSHDRLVAGGADLLAGRGELGESLFAAGSGIRGIHRLREALAGEAAAVFAARAGVGRPLNRALDDFRGAKTRIQESQLLPANWQKLVDDLGEGRRRLAVLEGEILRRESEVVRLERVARVLPLVSRRDAAVLELASYGEVGVLPADAGERRAELQEALRGMELQARTLSEEQSRRRRERCALLVPTELLAHQVRVDQLQEGLGAHRKAGIDLPRLQAEVAAGRNDADLILRDLGRSEPWQQAEALRVDALTRTSVRALAARHLELDGGRRAAARELIEARREADRVSRLLAEAPAGRVVAALRRLAQEVRRRGDLEAQVEALDLEVAPLQERARATALGLSGWEGELPAVRALAVPLREEVVEFETTFAQLDEESRELLRAASGYETQIRSLYLQLDELSAAGVLPSEEELERARGDRGAGWSVIKGPWIEGELPERFQREALAGRFEDAVSSADDVADQLRTDASRVAAEARLTRDLAVTRADLERTELDLADIRERRADVDHKWAALWARAAVQPGTAATMLRWMDARERVIETLDALDAKVWRREQLLAHVSELHAALGRELAALCGPFSPEAETLAGRVARAEELVEQAEEERRTRAALEDQLRAAEDVARRRGEEGVQAETRLEEWRGSWSAAAAGLGLRSDADPDEVLAFLDGLQRLFERIDTAAAKQSRVEHMLRDASDFGQEVRSLVAACLPSLEGLDPGEAAQKLVQALRAGRDALAAAEAIDDRLTAITTQLEQLAVKRTVQMEGLQALVVQARCSSVDGLPEAERLSRRWYELTELITRLQEQLIAEGQPLDRLLAQVRDVDPDQLPSLLERAQRERIEAREAAGAVREEVGGLQAQIDAIAGGDAAARAAGDSEEALARIGVSVEQYVDLKLASLLLAREIERYREEHQGPVIGLASRAFSRLTLGSFVGVTTGFDARDQPILMCRRVDGSDVDVAGLSDGTRDQLYLALRLASIEYRLPREEPLPLIVDDVLVNFDDERAGAAMELLGDLACKTQVLFFTHHHRLLELARARVPADRLQEHDLGALGTGVV